jgi:hypothetical protein
MQLLLYLTSQNVVPGLNNYFIGEYTHGSPEQRPSSDGEVKARILIPKVEVLQA